MILIGHEHDLAISKPVAGHFARLFGIGCLCIAVGALVVKTENGCYLVDLRTHAHNHAMLDGRR